MKRLKWLGGLAAVALLLSRPQAASRGAAEAMARWYASVAPALFPFLALMPLLTGGEAIGAYETMLERPMKACFGLPGAAAPGMIVGMAAGTPAGALAARNVAAGAGMDRGQLLRLVAATAGFSPAFLVGGIGVGMLNSAAMGWKLWVAQMLTQITLLILLRSAWKTHGEGVEAVGGVGDQPIRGAVMGILTICGYMAMFGALAGALGEWVGQGPADALVCLLDVPSGALRVSKLALPEALRLPLLAGMCGFGGMCVIAQSLGALKGCGAGAGAYMGIRVLAGAIEAGCMALLLKLPQFKPGYLVEPIREKPLAAAMLIAAILACPVMTRLKKSIS